MINCKYCNQPLPSDFKEQKAKIKSERIRKAHAENKARGAGPGPDRKYNYDSIRNMLWQGHTRKEIALKLGCSKTVIKAAIDDE